jgi:hypothetical protein
MRNVESSKGILNHILSLFGLGVDGGIIMTDAPGGDLSLDDIFGDQSSTQTTADNTSDTLQPAAPATSPAEPFLKTKTGTVYKSVEDAVTGIEHKDALIQQLRNEVAQRSGQDPLATRRQQEAAARQVNYVDDQSKYFEDIASAVERKDTKGYMDAQTKLIWDTLGPLAPTLVQLSKANAERVVSEQLPDFKGFLNSEQYSEIVQDSPLLADAIKSAEQNPAASGQLPELYKIAYLSSQGRRLPELVKTVRTEAAPVHRPTVHSAQVAPTSTSAGAQASPSLDSKEGRSELIKQMEAKGVANLRF